MNEKTDWPSCSLCGKDRPGHSDDCELGKLLLLASEMWWYIYQLEGSPVHSERCGGFESRLGDFLSYPGSSHFPSMSSPSCEQQNKWKVHLIGNNPHAPCTDEDEPGWRFVEYELSVTCNYDNLDSCGWAGEDKMIIHDLEYAYDDDCPEDQGKLQQDCEYFDRMMKRATCIAKALNQEGIDNG